MASDHSSNFVPCPVCSVIKHCLVATTVLFAAVLLSPIAWAQNAEDGFNPDANDAVYALEQEPDGRTLLGGLFTTLDGGAVARNRIARMNIHGSVDKTFDTAVDGYPYALALQSDGKILLGGGFQSLNGGSVARNDMARLNPDGSVDPGFDPDPDSEVYALAVQPDGEVLLGGDFSTLNGGATNIKRIARLMADGTVDATFNPDADYDVLALALQPDGKIVLGGDFSTFYNKTIVRYEMARLNGDGSVDDVINPYVYGNDVYTVAVQPDGKILLGGAFYALHDGLIIRNGIARLNVDGTVDSAFNPDAEYDVSTVAVQPDGKILLGGDFQTLKNGAYQIKHLARVNADGSVDAMFNPDPDGNVDALALQADGKILIGGFFTTLNGGTIARNSFARLNSDGTVDETFQDLGLDRGGAYALAVQPDGRILIGGQFTTLDGGAISRSDLARLSTTEAALQSMQVNGSNVTWKRGGAAPELALPPSLAFSLDGVSYKTIGTMGRITGGWRGVGLNQPVGQTYYLRVRGVISSGYNNGSRSQIERVYQFYAGDHVFHNGFDQ